MQPQGSVDLVQAQLMLQRSDARCIFTTELSGLQHSVLSLRKSRAECQAGAGKVCSACEHDWCQAGCVWEAQVIVL